MVPAARGGRHAANGDAGWVTVTPWYEIPTSVIDNNISGPGHTPIMAILDKVDALPPCR